MNKTLVVWWRYGKEHDPAGDEFRVNPARVISAHIDQKVAVARKWPAADCRRWQVDDELLIERGDEPLSADSLLQPANVYGETKRMVEQVLGWNQRVHGLRHAARRYFSAAGTLPGRGEANQPESPLIPRVLAVANGQADSVGLFGTDYPTPDGTAIRDYIHIADLVSAHLLVLEALAPEASGTALAYNLGNGAGYSVREVVETARAVTGQPIPVQELPGRAGDAARLVAASDKIRRELGWQPRVPGLAEIIASAWEWHRTHPNSYT